MALVSNASAWFNITAIQKPPFLPKGSKLLRCRGAVLQVRWANQRINHMIDEGRVFVPALVFRLTQRWCNLFAAIPPYRYDGRSARNRGVDNHADGLAVYASWISWRMDGYTGVT